mmetsp:Transcript_36165/g.104053  ORF Transcript_36165/g.104053 Transcript_36165/m.104053 type:complete len:350 (-) Transcript_36165:127-1176(-)
MPWPQDLQTARAVFARPKDMELPSDPAATAPSPATGSSPSTCPGGAPAVEVLASASASGLSFSRSPPSSKSASTGAAAAASAVRSAAADGMGDVSLAEIVMVAPPWAAAASIGGSAASDETGGGAAESSSPSGSEASVSTLSCLASTSASGLSSLIDGAACLASTMVWGSSSSSSMTLGRRLRRLVARLRLLGSTQSSSLSPPPAAGRRRRFPGITNKPPWSCASSAKGSAASGGSNSTCLQPPGPCLCPKGATVTAVAAGGLLSLSPGLLPSSRTKLCGSPSSSIKVPSSVEGGSAMYSAFPSGKRTLARGFPPCTSSKRQYWGSQRSSCATSARRPRSGPSSKCTVR